MDVNGDDASNILDLVAMVIAIVNWDGEGLECECSQLELPDCAGTPGGSSKLDACGVCGGDESSCTDCAGVVLGSATVDACGVCDEDPDNDCVDPLADIPEAQDGDGDGLCEGWSVVPLDCMECWPVRANLHF